MSKSYILDKDIFSYPKIEYYVTDENGYLFDDIKQIKPQDFLINMFNNEIISSKKKWLV